MLGLPPIESAQLLGILLGVATLWFVWSAGRILFPRSQWAPAMVVVFLASNRTFAVWAVEGMETKLFGACAAGALWAWLRFGLATVTAGRLPLVGIFLGLLILARPEGYLMAGLMLGLGLLGARTRRDWRGLAWNAAVPFGVAASHLAFRLLYYGEWLPNTFYAKVTGIQIARGLRYMAVLAHENGFVVYGALTVVGLIFFARSAENRPQRWYVVLALALYTLYLVAIGGDYFEFRFFDVALPYWGFLTVAGVAALAGLIPSVGWRRVAVVLMLTAWLGANALTVVHPFGGLPWLTTPERETEYSSQFVRAARWFAANLGPDESLAIRPAGVIAYLTRARCLDLLGLNDRQIARDTDFLIQGTAVGHQRMVPPKYAHRRGYTYYVGHPRFSSTPCRRGVCTSVEIAPSDFLSFYSLDPSSKFGHQVYRLGEHAGLHRGWVPRESAR
jgi:hypothetical protein